MALYDSSVTAITVVVKVVNRALGFLDAGGNVIAKAGHDAAGNVVPLPSGETTAYVSLLAHPTDATRAAVPVDAKVLLAIQAAIANAQTDPAVVTVLSNLPAPVAVLDNTWAAQPVQTGPTGATGATGGSVVVVAKDGPRGALAGVDCV